MKLPPLLHERPSQNVEMAILLVGPILFGAITGLMVGVSEIAYLVLSILGILGGFFAGLEHVGWRGGFYRGLIGGLLFGVSILLAHGLSGQEEKAHLPDPEILLVVITTLVGVGLGALGGRVRERQEAKLAAASRG